MDSHDLQEFQGAYRPVAQIQAELERLSEPRPEYGSIQALKTPRVFVLKTVASISDADLEKMSKKLSDTYGDKVVVIRIDSDDDLYSIHS